MKRNEVINLAENVVKYLENTGSSSIGITINGYPLKGQIGKSEIEYKALGDLFGNFFYTGRERTRAKDIRKFIKRRGERAVKLIGELSDNSEKINNYPKISGGMKDDVYTINISKKRESTQDELRQECLGR